MKNPFHYSHKKDYNGENRNGKYEANAIFRKELQSWVILEKNLLVSVPLVLPLVLLSITSKKRR